MLESVLRYLNNYFINDYCDATACLVDGVTVAYPDKFIAGQYIAIDGSILNNGVYKIASISGSKLVLASGFTMVAETRSIHTPLFSVWGLAIPKNIIDIVAEITAYNTDNNGNIKSETLGDYSVSYNSGDSSWIGAFAKRLSQYRKAYLIKPVRIIREIDDYD